MRRRHERVQSRCRGVELGPQSLPMASTPRSCRHERSVLIALSLVGMLAFPGCAVVSVAGAAAGAAISVGGAVVGTTVKVAGKVVEKTIDLAVPGSPPMPAK